MITNQRHEHAPADLDHGHLQDLVCAQATAVLGGPVAASDNFFALGGDSLRAGRFVMRLTRALEGRGGIELQDVFDAEDFAALTARVGERLAGSGDGPGEPTVPAPRTAPPPTREPAPGDVPLTYGQLRRLQRDAESVGQRIPHHVSRVFHLTGLLDLVSLEAACHDLLARHASLRTCFAPDPAGEAHRAFRLDTGELNVDRLFRVRPLPAGATVEDEAEAEQTALFDLATEAKLRVLVLTTGAGTATVVITTEHLVCDGDSFTVLVRDLSALYNRRTGAAADEAGPLPEIEARCWAEEESGRQHAALEERLAHWRTRLDPLEALPEVRLPGMRDPAVWPTTAAQCHGHLSAQAVERLRAACAAESATLFCGFVAALGLAVLDDAGHTVAGMVSPSSGRPPGWEHHVDWFATSVINRFRINAQLPVREVTRSAKHSVATGLANAVPLPLLLEHLQYNRDVEQRWRPWLYLALDTYEDTPLKLHGVRVEPAAADVQLALRAGLTLRIETRPDASASVLLQYEREVWSAERAEEFMATFLRMVDLVSDHSEGAGVAALLAVHRASAADGPRP
ncbi:condensation domain-containing protein [Streptomyces purpureus]|uniref:condensation domain-containing protein n=1 Tax=Streptomyces purpureus TaxID=1951 RepID=UPI001E31AB65|nr:condensation domain-containing protein [Streptomyces purpureus]